LINRKILSEIFCVTAKNNGQSKIPVTIYPCKLSDIRYDDLIEKSNTVPDNNGLWIDLKQAFDNFYISKKLPVVEFLANGRHNIK